MKNLSKSLKYQILSYTSFLVFLAVWQLATDVLHVMPPYALPSPAVILRSFVKKITSATPDGSTLIVHILASLQVSLMGYGLGILVGVPLGVLMAWYRKVDIVVRPVFDMLRPIPPVSLIPIMILLLGIGVASKVAVIFFSAFIPCVINSYSGIKQTRPIHLWVAQTFGATNLQMLRTVALPTALPLMFTGLKVSLGASWMSLVAAELLAATKGVGYMIQIARTIGRADLIVVGMLVIGGVGLCLSATIEFLERMLVRGGR